MGLALSAELEHASLFAKAEHETGWLFGPPEENTCAVATTIEAKPLPRSMKPRIRLGDPLPVAPAPAAASAAPATIAPAEPPPARRMTRERLIERIIEMNPTVNKDFLAAFDRDALHRYLERLVALAEPRGRMARWIRTGETPAILGRERPD